MTTDVCAACGAPATVDLQSQSPRSRYADRTALCDAHYRAYMAQAWATGDPDVRRYLDAV